MADRIQQRRDTRARWEEFNPLLLEGEVGYVTDDPNLYKIGDGINRWNSLPYRGFDGTITQETGNSENAVMSQKAVSEKLSELGSKNFKFSDNDVINNYIKEVYTPFIPDNYKSLEVVIRFGRTASSGSSYYNYIRIGEEASGFVEVYRESGFSSVADAVTKAKQYVGLLEYNGNYILCDFSNVETTDSGVSIRKSCNYYDTTKLYNSFAIQEHLNKDITNNIQHILGENVNKTTTLEAGKVIYIVGIGTSGVSSGVSKVGDVFYNGTTLRECIYFDADNISNNKYEDLPFVDGTIYVIYGKFYKWENNSFYIIDSNNISFEVRKGYSIKSSQPTESALYSYSTPILLKKGQTLVTILQNKGAWAISETDANGSSYSKISAGDDATYKEYVYKADRAMYIALCWRSEHLERPLAVFIANDYSQQNSNVVSVEVSMQGGHLSDSTGYMEVATSDRAKFMNYIHSVYYYNTFAISDITLEDGETCYIYSYDKDYKFLSKSLYPSVHSSASWIKVEIQKEQEYSTLRNVAMSYVPKDSCVQMSLNVAANTSKIRHFSFEIQAPLIEQEGNSANANLVKKRHYDNGFIILPPNYTPSGAPVPLIVFWHGTGGYDFKNPDAISYRTYLQFLSYNGYAVVDCSGMSDKFQLGDEAVEGYDCRMNPMALSCFKSLYDFVSLNYNIKKDGAYVFGKSNGALGTVMLGYTQPFPIKALASLAGSLSLVASFRFSTDVNLNYWLGQFGVNTNYDYNGYLYYNQTSEIIETISSYADKYSNYDPMIIGTDIDAETFAKLIFNNGYINHTMSGEELLSVVNSTKKYFPKPIKIWHANDDTSVPIETSRFFKRMIDNLHGICYLREFPDGYGGHHAVDNSELAPKTIYPTKYNGDIEIPTAYAELVEWFNQW